MAELSTISEAQQATLRGYKIEDLMFIAAMCEAHQVTPEDIKELKDNWAIIYNMVREDMFKSYQRAVEETIKGINPAQDWDTKITN